MKHALSLSCRATLWMTWIFLLALPLASHAFPVLGSDGWALTPTGGLVSCLNNAPCFTAQADIPFTTPRTIKFTGTYQGPTISMNSATGHVFVAVRGLGRVTFTTRVTNLSTGALLASGTTTTSYVQGSITCADRGLSPHTNGQPLLLVAATGALLTAGSNVELSISITSAQPISLGICVGKSGSSFTTSTLNLSGFMVPTLDSSTPACGSTAVADASGTYSFEVVGSHPSPISAVVLTATGVPSGATLTPPLPLRGSPVSTRFSWKPPGPQRSFDVTFTASDEGVTTKVCKIHFDFDSGKTRKESILVSPPNFPQKVTFETVCGKSVADKCLTRELVEICVGGKCFGVPQQEPPCKLCELGLHLRPPR